MNSVDTDAAAVNLSLPRRGSLRVWALKQIGQRLHCGALTVITPEQARAAYRGAMPGQRQSWFCIAGARCAVCCSMAKLVSPKPTLAAIGRAPTFARCWNWQYATPRRSRQRSMVPRRRGSLTACCIGCMPTHCPEAGEISAITTIWAIHSMRFGWTPGCPTHLRCTARGRRRWSRRRRRSRSVSWRCWTRHPAARCWRSAVAGAAWPSGWRNTAAKSRV